MAVGDEEIESNFNFFTVLLRVSLNPSSSPSLPPSPSLHARSEECREAAAGAIRNIAADSDEAKHMIADHEACIREVVRLLGTGRPKIQLNAVEALVNLTSDQSCREIIAEQGGIAPLVMLVGLREVDGDLKEMAARALAGLAAEELNRQYIARAGGIRFLAELLADEAMGDGPRAGAAMALANLAINGKNRASMAEASLLNMVSSLLVCPLERSFRSVVECGGMRDVVVGTGDGF